MERAPKAHSLADDRDTAVLRRRSVRGTAVTFGAQGARFVIQFGSQILLANLLIPADFGLIAMVTPLLYLVQMFNELGLMQATVQREEITREQLSALFWFNMVVGLALCGGMMLLAPAVAWLYGDARLAAVTVALSTVIILSALSAQHMALLTRQMKLGALSLIDVASITVASLAGLLAARLGARYWALVIMQAANMATIAALATAFSGFHPGRPRRGENLASLLRFGGNVAGHNIITFASYNLPSVLIGACFNSTLLGLYDRSFRLIVVPLWQLNAPLDRVGIALLSRLRTADAKFTHAYYLMLQLLMVLTVPGFVWAAAMSGILVPSVLGQVWTGAVPIVSWLALSAIPAPIIMSTYWVFVSQGRSREQLRNGMVRTAVGMAAVLAGLPWGPIGVAISAACSAPLMGGIAVWGVTRQGPVTVSGLARATYPVLAGAAGAGALLHLLAAGSIGAYWPRLELLVLTLPLSYLITGLVMLGTPEGFSILRTVLRLRRSLGVSDGAAV